MGGILITRSYQVVTHLPCAVGAYTSMGKDSRPSSHPRYWAPRQSSYRRHSVLVRLFPKETSCYVNLLTAFWGCEDFPRSFWPIP